MSARAVLLSIGGVILLAGLVLGFVPQSARGHDCGSVLKGRSAFALIFESTDAQSLCDDRRATYRPIVWTLIATGGLLSVIGLGVGATPTATEKQARLDTTKGPAQPEG